MRNFLFAAAALAAAVFAVPAMAQQATVEGQAAVTTCQAHSAAVEQALENMALPLPEMGELDKLKHGAKLMHAVADALSAYQQAGCSFEMLPHDSMERSKLPAVQAETCSEKSNEEYSMALKLAGLLKDREVGTTGYYTREVVLYAASIAGTLSQIAGCPFDALSAEPETE